MDYELAKFVAWIESEPHDESLIDEVKGLTFVEYAEFALLRTDDRQLLVKGGRKGILFELDADGHMIVSTPIGSRRVLQLLWHTHPIPTGPSDHDRGVLRLLGQKESVIYELNGEAAGTRIYWQRL
jgi:hypothetical protein